MASSTLESQSNPQTPNIQQIGSRNKVYGSLYAAEMVRHWPPARGAKCLTLMSQPDRSGETGDQESEASAASSSALRSGLVEAIWMT